MKIASVGLAVPVLLIALVPALAACSGDDGPQTASDPATGDNRPPRPTEVPAAPGKVSSRYLPTVMDTGTPELCLGAIAESYPPQCGGPEITNWDWSKQQGVFDQQGDIRWGTFAVTGTWDGTAFTVTESIPGPLYDPMPQEPPVLPEPSRAYEQAELDEIAQELGSSLPGAQGGYADQEGHVLIDVLYDDGTIQDYADAEYGADVVVVIGGLVDVTG
ncbi:MAG: hypothetical protein WB767_03000 [Nocardioides sp.]